MNGIAANWQAQLGENGRMAVERVDQELGQIGGRLGVAFSGGVDSAVLTALAAARLGADNVVAILGVSASLASSEHANARAVADQIGVELVEVRTHEGTRPAYVANGPDRCFHCRTELFERIGDDVIERHGLAALAYGENADDAERGDRPGAAAAAAHSVLRPLATARCSKAVVREVARAMQLKCADKPAAPCLASRIPHHSVVTPDKLSQVERAEAVVRELGFPDSRVRHHGDVARVELPAADLVRAVSEPVLSHLRRGVREAGFRFVALDLGGIQSGAFTLPLLSAGTRGGGGDD